MGQDWNLGLETGIWASRLGFEGGGTEEEEEGEEEEKEKIPHMCESIGHRPLQGRCPAPSLKRDFLTTGAYEICIRFLKLPNTVMRLE